MMRGFVPVAVLALYYAIALGFPTAIAAQTPDLRYQIGGISCVPAAPTVTQEVLVTNEASIQFAQGSVGRLSLLCPIPFVGSFKHEAVGLTVLLRDPDGNGPANVEVSLRRIARSDGSASLHPDARLRSDQHCAAGNTDWQECSISFSDDLDFDLYYYFFRVTLLRSSRNEPVAFGGIRLGGIIP